VVAQVVYCQVLVPQEVRVAVMVAVSLRERIRGLWDRVEMAVVRLQVLYLRRQEVVVWAESEGTDQRQEVDAVEMEVPIRL
jgi:hypothetical protein